MVVVHLHQFLNIDMRLSRQTTQVLVKEISSSSFPGTEGLISHSMAGGHWKETCCITTYPTITASPALIKEVY